MDGETYDVIACSEKNLSSTKNPTCDFGFSFLSLDSRIELNRESSESVVLVVVLV